MSQPRAHHVEGQLAGVRASLSQLPHDVTGQRDGYLRRQPEAAYVLRELWSLGRDPTSIERRQAEREERPPVDRHGEPWSENRDGLRSALRVEVAGPDVGTPPPHGQQGHVDVAGERRHPVEEIGVTCEIGRRPVARDDVSQRHPARPASSPTGVRGRHGTHGQVTVDVDVSVGDLDDVREALVLQPLPTTGWHQDGYVRADLAHGRDVAVIVVQM